MSSYLEYIEEEYMQEMNTLIVGKFAQLMGGLREPMLYGEEKAEVLDLALIICITTKYLNLCA